MFQPGDLLMEPRGSLKNSVRIINPTRHTQWTTQKKGLELGSVIRRQISVNPRLNINPSFFISPSKSLFRMIFSPLYYFFFTTSNHQIIDKRSLTEFLINLLDMKSNFTLTLGYLNPALNNQAWEITRDVPNMTNWIFYYLSQGGLTTLIWTIHLHNTVQTNDGTSNILSFH